MSRNAKRKLTLRFRRAVGTTIGGLLLTLAFFLVLPLIQAISSATQTDTLLRSVDTVALPPPPPPPPELEEEAEPEAEEKPPEMQQEAPPLDLSQLELALNPGIGSGASTGDFALKLGNLGGGDDGESGGTFSVADLDQQPRVLYPHNPTMTPAIRRKAPGTVYIVFLVDEEGRVQNPVIQQSTDPVFDRPALDAIKKWKFEPGKRNGKPVRFRMRQPITFKDK